MATPSSPLHESAKPGTTLDLGLGHRYRLEKPLGQSSCGSVWGATWLQTGAPVAVKMLGAEPQDAAQRALHRQALARESEQLRQLRHRHVLRWQRCGSHQGEPVLVLEAMHESMHAHLAGVQASASTNEARRLPMGLALRWAHQVALGLGAMHQAGLRHLDLKPANLLLTAPGPLGQRVKIADFGACLAASTREQTFLGTPGWLAPEQLRPVSHNAAGQPLFRTDARTDVYALGQLLFALLTGQSTEFARMNRAALCGGDAARCMTDLADQPQLGCLSADDLQMLGALWGHPALPPKSDAGSSRSAGLDDHATWLAADGVGCRQLRQPELEVDAEPMNTRLTEADTATLLSLLQHCCAANPEARPVNGTVVAARLDCLRTKH